MSKDEKVMLWTGVLTFIGAFLGAFIVQYFKQ